MFFPFIGGLNGDGFGDDEDDRYPDCDGSFTDGNFVRDPLYYHTAMTSYLVKIGEVGKATKFHFKVQGGEKYPFLVPTKLIRYQKDSIYVHQIGVNIIREKLADIKAKKQNENTNF